MLEILSAAYEVKEPLSLEQKIVNNYRSEEEFFF